MPKYEITGPDGRTAIVHAPEGVSADEATAFAQANWAGWRDKGEYEMIPEGAEDAPTPMDTQRAAEKDFGERVKQFTAETGGALKPGQNVRQATAERFGVRDPRETANAAEIAHIKATGEVPYGESVAYNAAKPLAATLGFMEAGPAGATAAEGAIRTASLAYNLQRGINAGALTEDQAADIMAKELLKGVGVDAAFNFGVPMVGKLVANLPGMSWVGNKVGAALQRAGAKATAGLKADFSAAPEAILPRSADDLADEMFAPAARGAYTPERQAHAVATERAALAATPEGRRAATELQNAMPEGTVLTPGQVTGTPSVAEQGARMAHPKTFETQEKAAAEAAETLRQRYLRPAGQPTREELGKTIVQTAENVEDAVKARLAPEFKRAEDAGVSVDYSDIVDIARKALEKDASVAGGKGLKAAERAKLQKIIDDIVVPAKPAQPLMGAGGKPILGPNGQPLMGEATPETLRPQSAAQALGFESARKGDLRAISAEDKPSTAYEAVVNDMVTKAKAAFDTAADSQGQSGVKAALAKARKEYGQMMQDVYEDGVKQALRAQPEDVGRKFWSGGNVTEIKQMHRLLRSAQAEGKLSEQEVRTITGNMTRGFLQEGVRDVNAAANWSQTLRSDPLKRDTWEAFTAGPGGDILRKNMEVLEQAAQMATRTNRELNALGASLYTIPLLRATRGGLGVSYVTGTIHPGMAITGLTVDGATKVMATAYTQGNKGVMRDVARVLRASQVGTPASVEAMKQVIPGLERFAQENQIDLFTYQQPGS